MVLIIIEAVLLIALIFTFRKVTKEKEQIEKILSESEAYQAAKKRIAEQAENEKKNTIERAKIIAEQNPQKETIIYK